jgi:hypothetical protein
MDGCSRDKMEQDLQCEQCTQFRALQHPLKNTNLRFQRSGNATMVFLSLLQTKLELTFWDRV